MTSVDERQKCIKKCAVRMSIALSTSENKTKTIGPKIQLLLSQSVSEFHSRPLNRGILVYNICLISISNSVFDGATNKSVLNIERS